MYSLEQRLLAKEIFHEMYNVNDPLRKYPMCFDTAKGCAVISITKTIEALSTINSFESSKLSMFYIGVKNYLINLTKKDLENEK